MKDDSKKAGFLIRNPDAVLHEEDDDGALVFNPDNDQVKVLNKTGLVIWKLCDGTNDLDVIVAALKADFEGAADHPVMQQVRAFVDDMVGSGFIGTVENG